MAVFRNLLRLAADPLDGPIVREPRPDVWPNRQFSDLRHDQLLAAGYPVKDCRPHCGVGERLLSS